MRLREKLHDFTHALRGSSPKPPGRPATVKLLVPDAQPPPEPPNQSSAVQAEPKDAVPPPQRLEFQGCWREAYEQLQEENGDMVHTFETFLLQQSRTEDTVRAESDPLPLLQSLVEDRLQEIENSRFKITVAGKEFVVREQARRAVHAIRSVKEFISTAVSAEPHAALAWAGALLLLHPVAKSVVQDEHAMSAFENISNILVRYRLVERTNIEIYSKSSSGVSQKPPEELGMSVRAQTVKLYAKILGFQIRLAQHFCKSGFYRFVDDLGVSDDWNDLLDTITRIDNQITLDLDALGRHTLKDIHREVDETRRRLGESLDLMAEVRDETREIKKIHLLDRLPVSNGAVFSPREDEKESRCLEDTQVSTLSRIQEWYQSPMGESIQIYWLKGMAGTGKSTISRTVAAACHNRQPLVKGTPSPESLCIGANFFFDQGKKNCNNANKLFTTICKQLATALPDTKNAICKALSDYPDIWKSMSDQWNYLILQPLLSLQRQAAFLPLTLVIVIDALDECEKTDIQRVLARFVRSHSQGLSTIRLRIFITSRPEAHIFSAFRGIQGRCEVHEYDLQKVPFMSHAKKEDDITRFLRLGMAEACKANEFPEDWPGKTTRDKISLKADGLWIFAATTCRFFQEPGLTLSRAKVRLDLILDEEVTDGTPQHNLDAMYRRILKFSVIGSATKPEIKLICGSFKKIIGTIVVLFELLSKTALSHLLSLDESELDDTFKGLYSVLSISEGQKGTVKLLHLSFRDFLLSQQRCSDKRFWICENTTHYNAMKACLYTLSVKLQENFYGLPHPSAGPADIDRFPAPFHLQYAGLYWVDHLQHSAFDPGDNGEVHNFLKTHFLHWIEFMSASHKLHEAVSALMSLTEYISRLPDTGRTELRDFLQDARRFMLMFRTVIEIAPLQIYRSALVYCPEMSIIRKHFQEKIPKSYSSLPTVESEWSLLLQTFEDRGEDVALSPDGKLVASPSVRIWDVTTGTLLKTFEPLGRGAVVAFSPDGEFLLSLSSQGNLRVWDLATDELRQEVKSLSEDRIASHTHVFSHNRSMAACASDTEIQLIDVVNGKATEPLNNHSKINNLTFSWDGQVLASASVDIVRIWDTRTHSQKELRDNEAYGRANYHRVAFSNDIRAIAALSGSSTIRIWDVAKGTLIHKLEVALSSDIVFLPDNETLLSSGAKNVHAWDFRSGKLLRTIDADCTGLRVSPDGKLFTSMAAMMSSCGTIPNGPIRVWDTATSALPKEIGKQDSRYQALFSTDNSILAIASEDAIRLWDLNTQSMPESRKAGDNTLSLEGFKLSPSQTTATCIRGGMISLWDFKTGVIHDVAKHCFRVQGDSEVPDGSDLSVKIVPGYRSWAEGRRSMLFSPDSNLLLTTHFRGGELWDTATRKRVWSNHDIGEGIWAFSPDGSLLAYGFEEVGPGPDSSSSSKHPSIIIWDVQARTPLRTLERPNQKIEGLAFSPNNKRLACIWTEMKVLEIRDVTDGLRCTAHSTLADLKGPIVWSPDGKMVSCGSRAENILFFCANSGRFLWSLDDCRERDLLAFAFSPDGKLLVSTDDEKGGFVASTKTISLWEINSQRLIGTRRNSGEIYGLLRFSDDGKTIHSNFGRMDVRAFYPEPICHEDLFLSENWIWYGENEAILLPHDYRATRATATGNTLVTRHETGQVTLLGFEEKK
ncbi:hypothetical protein N7499_006436 [Penicillium canescens]|nr:hypothetical protein N7499_006436 [Penicillium canescens]KAJ6176639.1 hypothetical protein N7485_003553 [Penicillium canescens]